MIIYVYYNDMIFFLLVFFFSNLFKKWCVCRLQDLEKPLPCPFASACEAEVECLDMAAFGFSEVTSPFGVEEFSGSDGRRSSSKPNSLQPEPLSLVFPSL